MTGSTAFVVALALVHAATAQAENGNADAGPASERPQQARRPSFNTTGGPTGGFRLIDAASGAPGSFRLQLAIDRFDDNSFLYPGDSVERTVQRLTLSWTPLSFLEVFGGLSNLSTTSDTPTPRTLHAQGDSVVGLKAFHPLSPIMALGGDARVLFFNRVGENESAFESTSVGLRAAWSADFRQASRPFPLLLRGNLGYLFDNTGQLVETTEDTSYDQLDDPAPRDDETRHLVSRLERFALGINRSDLLRVGVGAEAPLELGHGFALHPIVEAQLGIPINRQGYDCPFDGTDPARGRDDGSDDCFAEAGVRSYPISLDFGLRALPPVRGLSIFGGVKIGLSDRFVRELAPQAPFALVLAVSLAHEPKPARTKAVIREVEVTVPEPAGRVAGRVVHEIDGTAVAGAEVRLVGAEGSAWVTDAEGAFLTSELPVGEVAFVVSHADFEDGECAARVAEGERAEVTCSLKPLPVVATVTGHVTDGWGVPVTGVPVAIEGPERFSLSTDLQGRFEQSEVPAGQYRVEVRGQDRLWTSQTFRITGREPIRLTATSRPRPERSAVSRRAARLRVRGVSFEQGSATLAGGANAALAELADLLLRNPDMQVRIEGPNAGRETLGLSRAESIQRRLVAAGVAEQRLQVTGIAGSRVRFVIVE